MNVNLLDPVERDRYIAQKKEYDEYMRMKDIDKTPCRTPKIAFSEGTATVIKPDLEFDLSPSEKRASSAHPSVDSSLKGTHVSKATPFKSILKPTLPTDRPPKMVETTPLTSKSRAPNFLKQPASRTSRLPTSAKSPQKIRQLVGGVSSSRTRMAAPAFENSSILTKSVASAVSVTKKPYRTSVTVPSTKKSIPETPKFNFIRNTCDFRTPSTSKFSQMGTRMNTQTKKTVDNKEVFTPSSNLDFDITVNQTPSARPSIMNVDLLNPIERENYKLAVSSSIQKSVPKRLDADMAGACTPSAYRLKMSPMASIEHFENESRPEVTLSAVKRHVPSTPRLGVIQEDESCSYGTSLKSVLTPQVNSNNEMFVPAVGINFDENKRNLNSGRPSIMDVDILNPLDRANFIARKKEYEYRGNPPVFLTSEDKENKQNV